MNAIASIPTMEAPHHGNLVAPFLGRTDKGPGTEGELRGFEVSFWTPRDWLGPADPSNPWHLGNRVGNHSMWQAANLVETEGRAGNSVAVSATKDMIRQACQIGGLFHFPEILLTRVWSQ